MIYLVPTVRPFTSLKQLQKYRPRFQETALDALLTTKYSERYLHLSEFMWHLPACKVTAQSSAWRFQKPETNSSLNCFCCLAAGSVRSVSLGRAVLPGSVPRPSAGPWETVPFGRSLEPYSWKGPLKVSSPVLADLCHRWAGRAVHTCIPACLACSLPRAWQRRERKKPLRTGGRHFVLLCCGPPEFCPLQVCSVGAAALGNGTQRASVGFSPPNGDSSPRYSPPAAQAEVWHCLLAVISPLLSALTRCHPCRF